MPLMTPDTHTQPNNTTATAARCLHLAQETLRIEAHALEHTAQQLAQSQQSQAFTQAVVAVLAVSGRIVVMGMGKSGHVGRKIAATLASTGTPAFFVHPAEAGHGDLGMVTENDVVLAISNSGESDELASILPILKRLAVPLVAITGKPQSTLGKHANWVLDSSVAKEACPLNLAPTASTTVQMALGDALAVALLDARGFRAEDFARSHPSGALGRQLLTTVADVMRPLSATPMVQPNDGFSIVMRAMGDKGLGATTVVDNENKLLGIFTDGDLRRLLESGADLRQHTAETLMHPQPRSIKADVLATHAAQLMEQHRITTLPVIDDAERVIGALNTHDLMLAKVI